MEVKKDTGFKSKYLEAGLISEILGSSLSRTTKLALIKMITK